VVNERAPNEAVKKPNDSAMNMKFTWFVFLAVLSTATSGCREAEPREVHLEVVAGGSVLLDGKPVSQAELPARLRVLKESTPRAQLRVTASPEASFSQLAPVMKAVQDAGLESLRFVTTPPQSGAAPAEPVAPTSTVRR
jgi:biopolymer transport protein ExbD